VVCDRLLARARVAVLVFIFFFQAEDGIRDLHVTGVQTCALPICHLRGPLQALVRLMGGEGLKRATQVAVLSANYIAKRPEPHYPDRKSVVTGKIVGRGGRRISKKSAGVMRVT